jgi:hypothetical protein
VFEVHFDADRYKWLSQHAMSIPTDRPGSISLFAGPEKIHRTLARHLVNEQLITETVPLKGTRRRWIRTGANHLLDCLAEAYAGLCRIGYRPPAVKFDGDPVFDPHDDDESESQSVAADRDDEQDATKRKKPRRVIVSEDQPPKPQPTGSP